MSIFALRGLTIALSMFVLVFAASRLAAECIVQLMNRMPKHWFAKISSNLWYALQVGPFCVATLVTCLLAVPSFLRFEPNHAEEEFGTPVVVLTLAALVVLLTGLYRALAAFARTTRTVRQWREHATLISSVRYDVFETGPNTPPLVVAGFFRPKLLISSTAARLLNQDELLRAMAHESTHIRNHDNLKKFLLRLCSFPASKKLERKWLESIEIAADHDAVNNRREALDLASALVKASRLSLATAELATNLSADAGHLLHARVERLLSWDEKAVAIDRRYFILPWFLGASGILLGVLSYQSLLLQMHHLAELLMR